MSLYPGIGYWDENDDYNYIYVNNDVSASIGFNMDSNYSNSQPLCGQTWLCSSGISLAGNRNDQ